MVEVLGANMTSGEGLLVVEAVMVVVLMELGTGILTFFRPRLGLRYLPE